MNIEPPYESYVKTLKNFYMRVIKKHTNMLKLSRNLVQMIEDLGRNDNALGFSNMTGKK
jgi:hypothetical protein